MKNIYKTIAFAGANLLAIGNANGAAQVAPTLSNESETNKIQAMTDGQLRALEASHLLVYNGCKWGHAAFDPIKVDFEELSPEVLSLYSQMEVA